jgi:ABC-2 type transport system ATP-binding protein
MSIKVDQVVKIYGAQKAVNNISFEVKQGEIVGFLGPNGAGKSTTMKMITGYLFPDGGKIEVCGILVEGEGIATKQKIGYLPELNPLYQDMFVREYLEFIAGLHHVPSHKQRIAEVIDLTLIHDPEVLILDEPTTGLDPNQIIEIREVIRNLGKKKTILFSTHILQEVEALCDRVIIINKGKIVADAPLQELLDSPLPETANIVSLQPQARSLEHVFRALTGSAN